MPKIKIGLKEYDSYASVEYADQYFLTTFGQKWCSLDVSVKEKLLISATRSIDYSEWIGRKENKDQPLEFPRIYCCNKRTDDDIVAMACCEEAMAIYEDGSSDAMDTKGVSSIRVQDTEISFSADVKRGALKSETANNLLDRYAFKGARIVY